MGNKGINPKCPGCGRHSLVFDFDRKVRFCPRCGWCERVPSPEGEGREEGKK